MSPLGTVSAVLASNPDTRPIADTTPDQTADRDAPDDHQLASNVDSKGFATNIPAGQLEESDAVASVRRRGLEAPVILRLQASVPEQAELPDPGDGPAAKGGERPSRPKPVEKREKQDRAAPARVWPIPARSYTFTQAFGCVPQLGNLYFADANCPPEAPVVHTGIDMAAPEGTPFYAAASGWVTLAGYDRPTADANTRIIIQHDGKNDGYSTEYLHWIATFVAVGDYVIAGQPIGEVGNVGFSTGPHLHFSVVDLDTGEHIDPVRWLPGDAAYDGYPGRLPSATFRLPAGTTAGHPEGADPNPPAPPRRVKVPDSPPDSQLHDRERKEKRKNRQEKSSANGEVKLSPSGKDQNRKKKSKTRSEESDSDSRRDRNDRPRDRDSDRNRKRADDGKNSDRGDDRARRSNDRNRDARDSTGSDEKPRQRENDDQHRRRDSGSAREASQDNEAPKKTRDNSGRESNGGDRKHKSSRS